MAKAAGEAFCISKTSELTSAPGSPNAASKRTAGALVAVSKTLRPSTNQRMAVADFSRRKLVEALYEPVKLDVVAPFAHTSYCPFDLRWKTFCDGSLLLRVVSSTTKPALALWPAAALKETEPCAIVSTEEAPLSPNALLPKLLAME